MEFFLDLFQLLLLLGHLFFEVSVLDLKFSAHSTSYSESLVCAIRRMLNPQRTIVFALAFVTWRTLSIMAMHAIIVRSSTVVGCNVTAKVALVLNIGLLMLLTEGDTKFAIGILSIKLTLWALELVLICSKNSTTETTKHYWLCSSFLSLLSL